MNNKQRLWRVEVSNSFGLQAPSFWVETSTPGTQTREVAEQEALQMAKEHTALSRFPEIWYFRVEHLENMFQIDGRWVQRGVYRLKDGIWVKNRENI